MNVMWRWLKLFTDLCLCGILVFLGVHYKTGVYLAYQAQGQLRLLSGTVSLEEFEATAQLSLHEKQNLDLIAEIKKYSVDSLAYKPTKNFTTFYDQKNNPVLWVITACDPYALTPFEWTFPVVGQVSYKGFFRKDLADKEFTHMVALGYDADLRPVSAWSTLGWLKDPVLSGMLKRSKGGFCNLLFHELFHATYYAPSSVDFNENIASFIAHKATQRFLKNDTASLREYMQSFEDTRIFNDFMLRRIEGLKRYYLDIKDAPNKYVLKLKAVAQIADSIEKLPLRNKKRYLSRREEMLKFKNAYFVDFVQYDSMQDSLDQVFNKIYKGKIEKLVQDLILN